jgi:hypothetical protein
MLNSLYNLRGVAKYQVGNLTHSDSHQINCYFPFTAPFYTQLITTASFASLFAVARVYNFTINATGESFFLQAPVAANATEALNLLNQFLPAKFTAAVTSTGFLQIDSGFAGTNGIFTLSIDGTAQINTSIPQTITSLQAGRLVVPVTTNTNTLLGLPDSQNAYRYPALGDSADLLASAVFVVRDGHTNISMLPDLYDAGNKVTAGTSFAGLIRGQIIPEFNPNAGALPTSALFVDTAPGNQGKLTAAASATALAIPTGKLRVVSGSIGITVPGLHEVRINY